jgi:hypothetical protein
MAAVAEMGRHRRAGCRRGPDLLRRRRGVADGGRHAGGHALPDERDRLLVFGRKRDQPDPPSRRALPPVELLPVGRADESAFVGAPRTVLRGDERAFEMDARDARRGVRIALARPRNRSNAVLDGLRRVRDHRRVVRSHALGPELAGDAAREVVGDRTRVEVEPAEPVDLEIDEARSDERVARPLRDRSDGSVLERDREAFAGLVVAAGQGHRVTGAPLFDDW